MTKKIYLYLCLLFVSLSLSGCGSGISGSSSNSESAYLSNSADGSYKSAGSGIDSAYQSSDESLDVGENGSSAKAASSEDADPEKENQTSSAIDLEKIIYSGNIRVYTEEFDKTMDSLNQLIEEKNGFIENSTFRDSNATSGYSKDYKSHYSYEATIRVPSKSFHEIMNAIGDLGKASEKSTNAENVTQEYNDLNATLEVYTAQRERYMEQLKKTKDDNIALQLQEKILGLDTTIAQYKSRMANIDNQVSYSSIHINVDEYYIYEEEQERENEGFLHKIGGVLKEAGENLMDLFLIILNFITIWVVRILVYGVLIILIIKLVIALLRFFGIVKSDQKFTLRNLFGKGRKKSNNHSAGDIKGQRTTLQNPEMKAPLEKSNNQMGQGEYPGDRQSTADNSMKNPIENPKNNSGAADLSSIEEKAVDSKEEKLRFQNNRTKKSGK